MAAVHFTLPDMGQLFYFDEDRPAALKCLAGGIDQNFKCRAGDAAVCFQGLEAYSKK